MIWVCPVCHGTLSATEGSVRCERCHAEYPRVGNIPDLRLDGVSWLDHREDLLRARSLHALATRLDLTELVRTVFARRPDWDKARIELRTGQVLDGPKKCQAEMAELVRQGLRRVDTLLDLGCGPGMLTAAAAPHIETTLGIDVSMEWLVVAERLILEHGGRPILAAAMAERMPLPRGSVGFVASLDVIEHVGDPARYLSEIDRILGSGGRMVLSTPNRFSITAEPHVFVWGVGWIPRRWQKAYVKALSGKSYDDTCLLSYWSLKSLIGENTQLRAEIIPGTVSNTEIDKFSAFRRKLARLYNRVHRRSSLRWLFRVICPFFYISGVKHESGSSIDAGATSRFSQENQSKKRNQVLQ